MLALRRLDPAVCRSHGVSAPGGGRRTFARRRNARRCSYECSPFNATNRRVQFYEKQVFQGALSVSPAPELEPDVEYGGLAGDFS